MIVLILLTGQPFSQGIKKTAQRACISGFFNANLSVRPSTSARLLGAISRYSPLFPADVKVKLTKIVTL